MKSKLNNILLFILLQIALIGCSYFSVSNEHHDDLLKSALKNPKIVEGELKLNIKNIRVLTGEELAESNRKLGIPENTKPTLKIWSADINNHITQSDISDKIYSPYPYRFMTEPENSNTILYYDLSGEALDADSITITRKFRFVSYEYELFNFNSYDNSIKLSEAKKSVYTKSERFLEQSDELLQVINSLEITSVSDKNKIEKIFGWVSDNMEYKYPPEKRGVKNAFSTLKGDCGQYTYLFVTLARIAGVPARSVNGFNFSPEEIGYHVWAEVFLDGYGWVPVDPTDKDGLFRINGHRLIASVGNNFILPETPEWANFGNSEVENGSTDFMQLASFAMSGIDAAISTERNIISFEDFE